MSRTMLITLGLALSGALLALGLGVRVAAQQPAQTPQRTLPKPSQSASKVVEVEKYTASLDSYMQANPQARRFFATNVSNAPGGWQEYPTEQLDAGTLAAVWMKSGKPVVAVISSKTPQLTQKVTYYFRDDRTLAKVHSEMYIVEGKMQAIRDRSYDKKFFLVRDFSHCADLETGRDKPCTSATILENSIIVYQRSNNLPFYDLLNKR